MDPDELDAVFRERPALHRFPGLDGRQGPGAVRGDRLATTATTPAGSGARRRDGQDLERRLLAPAGHRRDEGQVADRRARQAVRRPAARATRRSPRPGRRSATSTRPRPWRRTRPASAPTRRRCATAADRRTADLGDGRRKSDDALDDDGQPPHRHHDHRPADGSPRRIEIVFHRIDGRIYISGMPRRRAEARLAAQPRGGPAVHVPPQGRRSAPTCRRPRGSSPTSRSGARCSPRSSRSGTARTSRR